MKTIPLLILPLLTGLDGVGLAQGQSRDEAMVRSLDDQERIAALKKDTEALERLWSDQLVGNQPNNKVVADKRALMDALVRARPTSDRSSSFESMVTLLSSWGLRRSWQPRMHRAWDLWLASRRDAASPMSGREKEGLGVSMHVMPTSLPIADYGSSA